MCPMCNGPLAYGSAAVIVYRDGVFKVWLFFIFGKDNKPHILKRQIMLKPQALKPGDEIRLVATARKIAAEEVEPAMEQLRSQGFRPTVSENLFAEDRQFAGTDEIRAADLQAALDDPNVKAILCVRGGYGTVRLLDLLDFEQFRQQPKWIAGYSDVTALHNHLHRHLNVCSIHSTMPVNFPKNTTAAIESLQHALTGIPLKYITAPHPFNRSGETEGVLTGGNLSMIYSLMGSPEQVDTVGKILFLEDLDEYLYHIDRMVINLKRSGMFNELSGLILGGLTDMRDNTIPFGRTAEEIVLEAVAEFDFPVCFGFPAGHIDDNRALILGEKTKLAVGESGASFAQGG